MRGVAIFDHVITIAELEKQTAFNIIGNKYRCRPGGHAKKTLKFSWCKYYQSQGFKFFLHFYTFQFFNHIIKKMNCLLSVYKIRQKKSTPFLKIFYRSIITSAVNPLVGLCLNACTRAL